MCHPSLVDETEMEVTILGHVATSLIETVTNSETSLVHDNPSFFVIATSHRVDNEESRRQMEPQLTNGRRLRILLRMNGAWCGWGSNRKKPNEREHHIRIMARLHRPRKCGNNFTIKATPISVFTELMQVNCILRGKVDMILIEA